MTSGKIIIRPRRTQDSSMTATTSRLEVRNASTPAEDRDAPSNDNEHAEHDEDDNDDADDADDNAPTTNAATPLHEGDDGGSPAAAAAGAGASSEPAIEEAVLPPPRPRGRPRGRGRGALIGVSVQDAAVGAGAGGDADAVRAVGEGEASRFACRGAAAWRWRRGRRVGCCDGDGEEGGTPGVEGAVGGAGTALDEEVMGGGKPFRVIQGKVYVIEGDEFVTEDDAKGDAKIDKNGNLLGGRRFKAQTFNLPNRHPERMYMLAIDAARTSGFRDSLYYFRRNPLAHKLNATQPEKEFLIEIGKLGSHLRTRSVTLITARSAFKLHGSKTLIGAGRYHRKGPQTGRPRRRAGRPQRALRRRTRRGRARERAKGRPRGAHAGHLSRGGPTTLFGGPGWGPYSDGPLNAVRKSLLNRDGLNEENWMFVAAQRTAEASAESAKQRRRALVPYGGIFGAFTGAGRDGEAGGEGAGLGERGEEGEAKLGKGKRQGQGQGQGKDQEQERTQEQRDNEAGVARRRKRARREDKVPRGVYEPHSGVVLYRADTQPTRARWEGLKDSVDKRQVLGGTKAGNGAWALAWVDTTMELPTSEEDNATLRAGTQAAAGTRGSRLESIANCCHFALDAVHLFCSTYFYLIASKNRSRLP
ncbi:chromatin remodelling complex Rsc7/Swp82 subunit-domain-containing protein, partial [Russula brevipes]